MNLARASVDIKFQQRYSFEFLAHSLAQRSTFIELRKSRLLSKNVKRSSTRHIETCIALILDVSKIAKPACWSFVAVRPLRNVVCTAQWKQPLEADQVLFNRGQTADSTIELWQKELMSPSIYSKGWKRLSHGRFLATLFNLSERQRRVSYSPHPRDNLALHWLSGVIGRKTL